MRVGILFWLNRFAINSFSNSSIIRRYKKDQTYFSIIFPPDDFSISVDSGLP